MKTDVLELLRLRLFDLGGRPVTIATLLVIAMILVVAFLLSRLLRFGIHRALVRRGVAEGRRMRSIERLLGYVLMVVATVVALETAGIDLGAVVAATAVFAVGIGLAVQGVAVNFVSGIILLVEQSIKIDDIVELDGQFCRVMNLGIRATRVRTLFEEDILVPNSVLVQQPIKNITLHDSIIRVAVTAYEDVTTQHATRSPRVARAIEKARGGIFASWVRAEPDHAEAGSA